VGASGGSRQDIVTEARQSVRDKKRKIDELTAAMTASVAHKEPEPEPVKPKKKPKKVKKSKRQKLLHHSNTGSTNPSVDLVAAQLKTKVRGPPRAHTHAHIRHVRTHEPLPLSHACYSPPSCLRGHVQDLRDFLLWLYAVQATPSPAVFFSNPTNLPTTVRPASGATARLCHIRSSHPRVTQLTFLTRSGVGGHPVSRPKYIDPTRRCYIDDACLTP
jgi:hypothetical protein